MLFRHFQVKGEPSNAEKHVDHVIEKMISIHPLPNHENDYYEILSLVTPADGNMFSKNLPDCLRHANVCIMIEKIKLLH